MKLIIYLDLVFGLLVSVVQAQERGFERDPITGRAATIYNPNVSSALNNSPVLAGDSVEAARHFLTTHADDFGGTDADISFRYTRSERDEIGMSHVRFAQLYKGVQVFGGEVVVHVRADGVVKTAGGDTATRVEVDVVPQVQAAVALMQAQDLWRMRFGLSDPVVLSNELYVFNRALVEHKVDDTSYLVWRVHLAQESAAKNHVFFVDAHSGVLVYELTGTQHNLARYIWHCTPDDGMCWLNEYYSPFNYTYGRSEGAAVRGPDPFYGATDTDDVYARLGYSYDYYLNRFGRDGANGVGGLGWSYPFSLSDTTAFTYAGDGWDSLYGGMVGCPNAAFSLMGYLRFCGGVTDVDTVAHEYTHGVQFFAITDGVGRPAGLTYAGESGALNEALADIFGEMVENYVYGGVSWSHGALRSLSNPTAIVNSGFGPYPDGYYSPYYYCGTLDNGGVHHNLTVLGHAAYLMAVGGSLNGCNIAGVGMNVVEKVLYRAFSSYFTPSTNFFSAGSHIISACFDLYGPSECASVTKAMMAVEMDQAGICSGIPWQDPSVNCSVLDDLCPADPAKTMPGLCGCGVVDQDINGNGVMDCLDPQIESVKPKAPKLSSKKKIVTVTMKAIAGVKYVVRVEIPPLTPRGKKVTKTYVSSSPVHKVKALPVGKSVSISYSYKLPGQIAIYSYSSKKVKVMVK